VSDPHFRIRVPHRLDVGNREAFKDCVLDAINAGARRIAFDLADCRYMDSSGLGTLLLLRSRIKAVAGQLTLENPNEEMRELFAMTRLDAVFRIVPEKDHS
jgi:anti-sigma B factor antagonist